ncbi:MAG TPA: hypothetical protein VJO52_02595 [Gemmatimonadaceae bacterium]|nr:hypothetical protein [Gemmatimonadaceae bacterium]
MQFASTVVVLTVIGLWLPAGGASRTAAAAQGAAYSATSDSVLTADPLTGLPVDPATVCQTPTCVQFHAGNEPVKIPDSRWCKSKLQANFYTMTNVKLSATIAWYASHLHGFKRTHAYAAGRSDDTFYNAAGTLMVLVMGDPAKDGLDADTYAITYYRLEPGLSEKSIIGINRQQSVCS